MGANDHTNSTRKTRKVFRIFSRLLLWFFAIVGFVTIAVIIAMALFMPCEKANPATVEYIRSSAAEGKIAYKLTVPEDMKKMLGLSTRETITNDGGMQRLFLNWPGINATFTRMRDYSTPLTLIYMKVNGKTIDIGQDKPVVLKYENDLKKFDPFWGFAGVSLEKLDLRDYAELLSEMSFDSQTRWPDSDKLPENFNPSRILEEGKNPGLGIRSLHRQGIDGRGIGLAILDQPLLKDHIEYKDQLVLYEKKHLLDTTPAMHGVPLVSIAVGKNCGVAPKASLYYYAMRMTAMPDNKIYCDIIDNIIKRNKEASASEKIKVISISTGTFRQQKNYELWKETIKKAEQNGILVVTCNGQWLRYGTLQLIPGKEPDNPSSYKRGKYGGPGNVLLVPSGNKTTASHLGPEIYTYDTDGGMSQAAPYLAGLAVLAYQVNPNIEPQKIVELWISTAVHTDAGPIVNPADFIDAVRKLK
jgi:serine protease AprX